ncbi:MAG: glutamate--tRNA ligase [Elusimicrobia bacterium]|nr:glutamate--tRNA ligase [Elusimicrobiota bacterium]MDE2236281.1 glutamate--tRNA ligase [Elusimicrobiota bacterium]MDE2426559.1 glutamate--tRNA ligase [Elusimicrobiota bacterium]
MTETASGIRTRFAPSPTGFLHIGGARTTLFNWLFARRHKGVFVLRIEDTDEARSTAESVDAILESIRWLGCDWDEGPLDAESDRGPFSPYYQMKRLEHYDKYLRQLLEEGKAYRCYCSKEELDAMRRLAQLEKRPPRYDGRCRLLTERQGRDLEASGRKPSLRFRMPEEGATLVPDLIRGEVSFENRLQQDFVIRKTTGGPTYNFACVVDDHLMRISHVIRGDEHLPNTPSQLQLYRALGWQPPLFAHLSMIMGPDGGKLSKRHGATSVLEYKQQGFLPQALRNYLALLGWSTTDSQQLFSPEELIERFDLAGCQKNPATFDPVKLAWMNGEYIRKTPVPELVRQAEPFLKTAGLASAEGPALERTVALEQEKYKRLADIPGLIEFFYKPVEYTPKAMDKVLRTTGTKETLGGLAERLSRLSPFEEKALESEIRGFCAERGLKAGQVFHPLRAAVTGRTEGPTLFLMLEVMGREMVVSRLRKTIDALG